MRLRRLFAMRVRTSLAAKTSFLAPVAFKSALLTTGPHIAGVCHPTTKFAPQWGADKKSYECCNGATASQRG